MNEAGDESTGSELNYEREVIRRSTAAIIHNIGFSHAHNSSIDVLADLMETWFTILSQRIMRYTNSAGHTTCSFNDVSQALNDMDFNLVELNDYISSVASFVLPVQVPNFPVAEVRSRAPSSHTDVTDEITIRQLRADRHERIMSRFPDYTLILAATAADETETNEDNSFDSLASGMMALCNPTSLRVKSKKTKKKDRANKKTEDKAQVDDFTEPSSSLWLNKKRLNESSTSAVTEISIDEFSIATKGETTEESEEVTNECIQKLRDENDYIGEQEEANDDTVSLEEEKYEVMSSADLRLCLRRLRSSPQKPAEEKVSTMVEGGSTVVEGSTMVEEKDKAASILNSPGPEEEEEERSSSEEAQYIVVSRGETRLYLRRY